jgi:hypothetical protein
MAEPEESLTQNGFAGADILNMMRVQVPREQNIINNRANINTDGTINTQIQTTTTTAMQHIILLHSSL